MDETIPEMRERHKREIREAIARLAASRVTQTEAASLAGLTRQGLNSIVQREQIWWPVKRQGFHKDAREAKR